MFQFALHHLESIQSEVPLEHFEKMAGILEQLFPEEMRFEDRTDFLTWVKDTLPLIKWNECHSFPNSLSIKLLCLKCQQLQIESFFPEMLKKWLLPGKETSILSFNHMYFNLKDFPENSFFIGEIKFFIGTYQEWNDALANLAFLSKEINLALSSPSHAPYILMKRISSLHSKATMIHQELNRLMRKSPHYLEELILDEMGRFLALTSKQFLSQRQPHHITRLIASIYLIRKSLFRAITLSPDVHHIQLRFISTSLEFPFCFKPVLGCVIGISLVEEHEILEEKHILFAVKKLVPQAELVKGSCYYLEQKEEKIKTIYLELEKRDGTLFSLAERQGLKRELEEQLKYRIEKLMPPIFMIRNEEEVLRNILMLRREIRSVQDLPQVMISLDQQTKTEIIFTILWVSIRHQDTLSLQKMIQQSSKDSLICERVQIVGYLRKKHPIEVHVLRLSIPRHPSLLRSNLSLNFYLAREKAASYLHETLGEFRDYNGGVIFKQTEMLARLKQAFKQITDSNPDLMDDFFYSISPIEKQATISFSSLKSLFTLFLQSLQADCRPYFLKLQEEGDSVFVVIRFLESSLKEHLTANLDPLHPNLIISDISMRGGEARSYIFENPDAAARQEFCGLIEQAMEAWHQKIESAKVLHLSIPYEPTSLDPRLAGDEFTGGILRLLFEGLTRLNREGQFEYGMAESVTISPDQKHYHFKLRAAQWSNGAPVLAYDFEYAWKKILSTHFKTSFAYLLYPIKNAKEAKQGLVALDHVGIQALDDRTLHVELTFPTPYFLELTAHTIYFPVNHQVDKLHPNWPLQGQDGYICNGAFQLKTHRPNQCYEVTKNPAYWDAEKIGIDKIIFSRVSYHVAHQMFKKGELDWIGQPFGLWDLVFDPSPQDDVITASNTGVYWYVFNTERFPFNHLKLRRAFALAIDRHAISETLTTPTRPAYSPLTPFMSQKSGEHFLQENLKLARQLFEEALQELGLTRQFFPTLNLLYALGGVRDKAAQMIKQQWEKAFNIQLRLEPLEWGLALNKMKQGEFHLSGVLWRSVVNDPIYVLNSFRYSNENINLSRWEKTEYQQLLELADHELNLERRFKYLAEAEELIMREIPILPVFYTDFRAIVKKHLHLPSISPLGILDLKWTKFKKS